MPVASNDVRAVQRYYPQIYLACHTRHQRRRSNEASLTSYESSILAHLDEDSPVRVTDLAAHLAIGMSSMSAALKRLARLGYVSRSRDPEDARAVALRLSPAGVNAMSRGSVLDTGRVKAMLAQLTPAERRRALDGLGLLARASAALPRRKGETR